MKTNIVIVGGGIVGVSIAYYLAIKGYPCTIVEETGIACAASGKAGGFLARNWCASYELDALAKTSFDIHMTFADEKNNICEYRRVNTYSVKVDQVQKVKNSEGAPDWIDGPVKKFSQIDSTETTAQVHPYKLTHELLRRAVAATNGGTAVKHDSVVGITFKNNRQDSQDSGSDSSSPMTVTGVKLKSGDILPADKVVIAMGPWSGRAASWFPPGSIPNGLNGHRAHSVILQPPHEVTTGIGAQCLFLEYKTARGVVSPEVYPRPDGTVYVCGLGDDEPVPPGGVNDIVIERWRCSQLREAAYGTASGLEASAVLHEQACYLPISPDSLPLIGAVPGVVGGYIATGHSCWGILNAPGTGMAMADLLIDGRTEVVDLTPFDPARFQQSSMTL